MSHIYGLKDNIKLIYSFNTIYIKTPAGFYLAEIDKLILKCIWKGKGAKLSKTILKRRTKLGEPYFPLSKLTRKLQ